MTPALHQSQFARPSLGACCEGPDGGVPSRFRPAALNHVQHGSTHTELGQARFGVCASIPAVRRTGRFGGLGCITRRMTALSGVYDLLLRTGRASARPLFAADGERWRAPIVAIQCRRKGSFQALAERLPGHFKNSIHRRPTTSGAGVDETRKAVGEIQHHV